MSPFRFEGSSPCMAHVILKHVALLAQTSKFWGNMGMPIIYDNITILSCPIYAIFKMKFFFNEPKCHMTENGPGIKLTWLVTGVIGSKAMQYLKGKASTRVTL